MEKLTFRMSDAFDPKDQIAVWVMNLSIALGDLRVVAEYATRSEQPDYERIYFVRIFASHLREVTKLLVLDYRDREDVRGFVAALPDGARTARSEVERLLESHFVLRPDVQVWRDLKRLRDDTFHYATDNESQTRLRAAMATVAAMYDGQCESAYTFSDDGRLRADYADLVVANRMHPFEQEHEDESDLPFTRELHEAIIELNGHVAAFIQAAEAHYSSTCSRMVLSSTIPYELRPSRAAAGYLRRAVLLRLGGPRWTRPRSAVVVERRRASPDPSEAAD